MKPPKAIFDSALVRARRARGQRHTSDPFLHIRCADDAAERILDVNRNFQRTLILGNTDFAQCLIQNVGHKLGFIVRSHHSNCIQNLDIACGDEALPFAAESFDLIISGLNLHSVNHVPRALSEIRRLLLPDGLCLAALLGGDTLRELRHVFYEAEDTLYGQVSPRISPMISLQQSAGLLQSANFTMPVVDRDLVTVSYNQLSSLYTDIRRMGDSNTLVGRHNGSVSKRFFALAETLYRRDHTNAAGKLNASFDILWLTGWASHPDQQKPLKPGTAKTSLASALGVQEKKL